MKKTLLVIIMFALCVSMLLAQTADPPANGSGTSGDPYEIATLNNLYWITQNTGEWDKHYIQTEDIDASSTSGWDGGNGFFPIGNYSTRFSGTYDGQDHTIDALFIDRASTDYVGLFGYAYYAEIVSIGVTNVDITGDGFVAGLTGNNSHSLISNNYSTGSVSGTDRVGGLVGENFSPISNSYSTGSVSGTGTYVGGLTGDNHHYVENSFWDMETSGQSTSDGGTGKTTVEMKDVATFTDLTTVGLDSP